MSLSGLSQSQAYKDKIFIMTNSQLSGTSFNRRRKQRNIFAQMRDALITPVSFFSHLHDRLDDRSWLWASLIFALLLGLNAVRASNAVTPLQPDISDQVVFALQAVIPLFLAWVAQIMLMALSSLLTGTKPHFSRMLNIVVWASSPYALMALIQLAYVAAGGTLATDNLNGLLQASDDSGELAVLLGVIGYSLRIYAFWNLGLLWVGMRRTLNLPAWAAAVMLLLWVLTAIAVPTLAILMAGSY